MADAGMPSMPSTRRRKHSQHKAQRQAQDMIRSWAIAQAPDGLLLKQVTAQLNQGNPELEARTASDSEAPLGTLPLDLGNFNHHMDTEEERPRKRQNIGAVETSATNFDSRELSIEDLSPVFSMPLTEAADALGVCATTVKNECRRLGIGRWPYRQITKHKSAIEHCKTLMQKSTHAKGKKGRPNDWAKKVNKLRESMYRLEMLRMTGKDTQAHSAPVLVQPFVPHPPKPMERIGSSKSSMVDIRVEAGLAAVLMQVFPASHLQPEHEDNSSVSPAFANAATAALSGPDVAVKIADVAVKIADVAAKIGRSERELTQCSFRRKISQIPCLAGESPNNPIDLDYSETLTADVVQRDLNNASPYSFDVGEVQLLEAASLQSPPFALSCRSEGGGACDWDDAERTLPLH